MKSIKFSPSYIAVVIVAFFWISVPTTGYAIGSSACGDPPPVANEALKGEIEGEATLISRFIGQAGLSGQIEASRKEIFSKYPDAEYSRSNAFFEYQVCVLLMEDKKLSTIEKIEELKKIKRELSEPISENKTKFPSDEFNAEFEKYKKLPVVDVASLPETFAPTVKRSIESLLSGELCRFEHIALLDYVETASTTDGLYGVVAAVDLKIERADTRPQEERLEANGLDTSPNTAAVKARADLRKKIVSKLDVVNASCE